MPYASAKQSAWINEPELAAKWDLEYGGKPRRERTQSKRSKKRKHRKGARKVED